MAVERPATPLCLNCSEPLSLSQPDPETPDRLIGICEYCRHWFLVDLTSDLSAGTLCRLPDIQVIRRLSHENPSAGISLMDGDGNGDGRSASTAELP